MLDRKFGTFTGVFMPTTLTILGAVMYLRTGWVVGNAGLAGTIAIILLSNVITLSTGLSIASIATNMRVRAGGPFSIISQSLGLEVSGSISVPFYLAQSISVAFYIFAFSEGWLRIFPDHPEAVVVFGAFAATFTIAAISARMVSRAQFLILAIHVISLSSVLLGSFAIGNSAGFTQEPQLWGDFPAAGFWGVFAVFFPAVTGILAGVNMSGNLRNPRRSIPIGTIGAILVTLVIYLALAYWFSRVGTPEELVNNLTIIVDRSAWGPAVLLGILAATFSAAMTSLVGAPRVLQAIAQNGVIPGGESLSHESGGEPRNAMYFTGVITFMALVAGLLSGGLNAIAPFMTMFFLITYAVLNGVVVVEESLNLVSFRPMFRVPRLIPVVGLIGCIIAMLLITPIFTFVALSVILGLYIYLSRLTLTNPWGDVRSGLFVTVAEWAAKRVLHMPDSQERAWKPNLLVPVTSTEALLGSYRFLKAMTYPRGSVHVLGLYPPGQRQCVAGTSDVVSAFQRDGIFSRVALLEDEDFTVGVRHGMDLLHSAFFRPNALFLPIEADTDETTLLRFLDRAVQIEMGAILFAQHPTASLGREQTINVWIREQSPDWEVGLRLSRLDLSLLLAYQISHNWDGTINLISIVTDPAEKANGEAFLNNLITVGRMPRGTQALVGVGDFNDHLETMPRADLHIFGMQQTLSLHFVHHTTEHLRASCLFVQDSGHESALA